MRLASPAIERGVTGVMSLTRTATRRVRRPASRMPSSSPAAVPPRAGRDDEPLGFGQLALADLAAELEPGERIADAAARHRAARWHEVGRSGV